MAVEAIAAATEKPAMPTVDSTALHPTPPGGSVVVAPSAVGSGPPVQFAYPS